MSFLGAFFYDWVLSPAEDACLGNWRKELLKDTHGSVLEIGAGTGLNLEHYPGSLSSLIVSEPDQHMRMQLEKKILARKTIAQVSTGKAEEINAKNESFDFVVATLVCCSVTDLDRVLSEIKRVLKPGGHFIFLEHVAAPAGSRRRRWQNIINPVWKRLAGNCHLNRETESAILAAGFKIQGIRRESMRKAIPVVRPTIRGIALKP